MLVVLGVIMHARITLLVAGSTLDRHWFPRKASARQQRDACPSEHTLQGPHHLPGARAQVRFEAIVGGAAGDRFEVRASSHA